MLLIDAGAGERAGHGLGDGAAAVGLRLLPGGELRGQFRELGVQRVELPGDLAPRGGRC
ncbi:hypothetical protein [Streptomyces sp. NPDC056820]|uniref:hypothetical protein n=1 Tax=Streptomyces sp. NPDC056820 TaxID=3345951 RepID=UPI0036A74DF1